MDLFYTLSHGLGAHDAALGLVRVATGTFFACSGWNKLTNAARHQAIRETLVRDKVPLVKFNEWWVPGWEFVAGVSLALGFMTAFSAAVLIVICLVACACEARARVDAYHPINQIDRVADYLYLPEVLYVILLSVNVLGGTGKWSIDWMLYHG